MQSLTFIRSKQISIPDKFEFPYVPYKIQEEFMQALFSVIENRKIGIFESPTGTGKTLTLLSSSLKWINEDKIGICDDLKEQISTLEKEIHSSEEKNKKSINWLDGQFDTLQKKQQVNELKNQLSSIDEYDKKICELKDRWKENKENDTRQHKYKNINSKDEILIGDIIEDDEYIVEENSDDEDDNEIEEVIQDNHHEAKILFCSRTHSQLSQAVNELKKTIYGKSIRVVSLGSRQQYCINPAVKSLKSNTLINERCLEMKKKSSAKSTKNDENGRSSKKRKISVKNESCPYYSKAAIENVSQATIFSSDGVLDIEELLKEANSQKGCPYYATRLAAKDAQVIMLPYQMLLHKKTRDQLGLNVRDSVIIIDEAHNLLDTITAIHSSEVFLNQLQAAHRQLSAYKTKYLDRFSTKSLLRINQLISIINRFVKLLNETNNVEIREAMPEYHSKMIFVHELLDDVNLSIGNLFEILNFCENTRLSSKLCGFVTRFSDEIEVLNKKDEPKLKVRATYSTYLKKLADKKAGKISENIVDKVTNDAEKAPDNELLAMNSAIRIVLGFLECLMEKSADGKIIISTHRTLQSKSFMKYLLLNPNGPFEVLIRESRAVIVAGGTMQPTTEFKSQLFKDFSDRIEEHFFDHVVDKSAVLPLIVTKGPRGSKFQFNYANRGNKDMMFDLAMTLQNICNIVPSGIVCFFSSYDFMEQVYNHLVESKTIERIGLKKQVFKEPRSSGQLADKMLMEYTKCIRHAKNSTSSLNGALLLSVVGGKLSEGLNFSDDLGRCVCVVGLPFPNKTSPELSEKMKYLDKIAVQESSHFTGNEYYENLCMKAVNQCIGRAIRHINDYASVLLIDERYSSERIQRKLPQWISRGIQIPNSFSGVQGTLAKFFRERK